MAMNKLTVVNLALAVLGEPPETTLDPVEIRGATKKVLSFADAARDACLERHIWLFAIRYPVLSPSNLGSPDPAGGDEIDEVGEDIEDEQDPDGAFPDGAPGDSGDDFAWAQGQGGWNYMNVYELPGDFIRLVTIPDRIRGEDPGLTYFYATQMFPMASRWQRGTAAKGGATVPVLFNDAGGPQPCAYVARLDWSAFPQSFADYVSADMAARACRPINGDRDLAKELMADAETAFLRAAGIDGVQEGSQDPDIIDTFNLLRLSTR
jgi:hypothetical protein